MAANDRVFHFLLQNLHKGIITKRSRFLKLLDKILKSVFLGKDVDLRLLAHSVFLSLKDIRNHDFFLSKEFFWFLFVNDDGN